MFPSRSGARFPGWSRAVLVTFCLLVLPRTMPGMYAEPTGLDESLPLGFTLNDAVKAIQIDHDGRILIAGRFMFFNGVTSLNAARLTANGSRDQTFELGRGLDPDQWFDILWGGVRLLAPAGEGRAFVLGSFSFIHDDVAYRQALRVHEDGQLDTRFNICAASEGMTVTAALALPDHRLMIARRVPDENGSIRASVALLDEDGNLDPGFDSSLEANQVIHVLLRQPDGRILVAGAFTEIGGKLRDGIARLLSHGTLDESFDPGTTPDYDPALRVSQPILSLALQSDGRILAAGYFTAIGGQSQPHVARFESDGRLDDGFSVDLLPRIQGGPVRVNAVAVQPEDRVVIGGFFERVNGVTSPQAARFLPDGSVDANFETGAHRLEEVFAFALQPDGSLLVAGGNEIRSSSMGQLVRIKVSGELDTGFAMTGVAISEPFQASSVRAVAIQPDGNLVVGGRFTSFNRVAATNLIRIGPDGALDRTFQPGVGGNAVNALALDPAGRVLVAGDFPGGLARLLPDGTADPEFDVDEGIALKSETGDVWFVRCLAVQPDGGIVVGGDFDWAGGSVRRSLARFHPDGSLDPGFDVQLWADVGSPIVNAILVQPDGKLIIGGSFHRIGEVPRNAMARLHPSGEVDATFEAAAHGSSVVHVLVFDAAGNILIGGYRMQLAGKNVVVLARVDPSGTLDETFRHLFTPMEKTELRVWSIAIQPDGMVLAGGTFGAVDWMPRRGLVRLKPSGGVDPDFHVGAGFEASPSHGNTRLVCTLVLDPEGRLLAGGDFIRADGSPRGGLARWRTGMVQRNRLRLWREATSQLRLRLDGPIPAGTWIEVSSDLETWVPWQAGLESLDGMEWELEVPLEPRRFFRAVR
jgi:uncharacterized delta-60 repeat protein